jgi:hypothetical protein
VIDPIAALVHCATDAGNIRRDLTEPSTESTRDRPDSAAWGDIADRAAANV